MNNEELKKKIVEILDNNIRWQPYYYISRGIVYEDDLKNIADAIIAAGIGDVNEAEHRAEVAERALKEACSRAWSVECICTGTFEDNNECDECYKNQLEKRYEEKDAIDCLSKKLLQRAEKELSGGKK